MDRFEWLLVILTCAVALVVGWWLLVHIGSHY